MAQPTANWTGGGADANWSTTGNWVGGNPPGGAFVNVLFDGNSTTNLATVNNIGGLTLNTIGVGPGVSGSGQPAGAVSIGGPSAAFTLNGNGGVGVANIGIDMSSATQNLSITAGATNGTGVTLGANQTWNVATNTTLTVNAFISGAGLGITKTGGGTLSLPIMSNAAGGYGQGTIAMTILAGTVSVTDANNLGFTNATSTPNSLIINGGTFQVTTTGNSMNANRGVGLGANGGTIDTTTGVTLNFNSPSADAVSGTPGGLTKTGPGTAIIDRHTRTRP